MVPVTEKTVIVCTTVVRTVDAFLLPMISQLREAGVKVVVASNLDEVAAAVSVRGEVDELVHVGLERTPLKFSYIAAIKQMRSYLVSLEPGVVECHTPIASALWRIAAFLTPRRVRPRVIYFAHGFHFGASEGSDGWTRAERALANVERILARVTDHIVVINADDRRIATEVLGYSAPDITHLPGVGISLQDYVRPDSMTVARKEPFHIAVVGGLLPNKRPFEALEAAQEFATKNRVATKLTFAGDGPEMADLQEAADSADIEVEFLGRVDDVRPLLWRSNALLFLSEREGLPRTVLEAVCAGLPVVAHDIRGVRDILNGQNWWFVPTGRSASQVAESLRRAFEHAVDEDQMVESLQSFSSTSVNEIHTDLVLRELADRIPPA